MRKPMMAGNWKMHKTIAEAVAFAEAIKNRINGLVSIDRVVCPAYVALPAMKQALTGTDIALGAQDVHTQAQGAYTSCISAPMLQGLVDYVIVGHSETRQYLGVTDADVNQKAKIALAHGLKPIIAMGESLEQNEAGQTEAVCDRQIRAALDGITSAQMANVVIAYEPIWAIGTGKNATPEQAQAIIGGVVRKALADLYGEEIAQVTRILYGGSMKPANCHELMVQPDIDGGLVGGASLDVESFTEMIEIAIQAKGL
ncbi:MAG: triose-phosphate isomerase [Phototrophicales bacterium]|nr:MAG: triose-phosphate isomerase [Phototrophicales bacterium]